MLEGIETPAQAELAAELGVTQVQGFFYAHPMQRVELTAWLADRDTRPAPTT